MASRPLVQVFNKERKAVDQVRLPAVYRTPIRNDLVSFVHDQLRRNKRQPYAVAEAAGHQTAAESWGTGRAVARIPRVPGGGTHRAGQGAFGNMCRGGRMFAPTKIWRRWHRRVNVKQRRYAVASALAASALPALVMARGHRIDNVPEIPLVIQNEAVDALKKTKAAEEFLTAIQAADDVQKVKSTIHVRAGKGKNRNRRWVSRRGPLIVYDKKTTALQALRNVPGVELADVSRLNLLQLAPGGHLGRFVIFTKSAFEKLDGIFGTFNTASTQKNGYKLPRAPVEGIDIQRIIKSEEVQSVLRPVKPQSKKAPRRRNALKNTAARVHLNRYYAVEKRAALLAEKKNKSGAAPKPTAAQTKNAQAKKKSNKNARKLILKNWTKTLLS